MKVLILATDIYTRAGIARHTYTFAAGLASLLGSENVHLLALLAYGDPADLPRRFRVLGPISERLTVNAKASFALKALTLARNKYDLAVCSHLSLVPVAAVIHILYGTPFWVACYGTEAWGPLPFFNRVALRSANLLLPMSRYTAQKLLEVHKVPAPKMCILQTIIPAEFERKLTLPGQDESLATGIGRRRRMLLSVGSLAKSHAYKGFDKVIQALPAVLKRIPDTVYVIVGDGNDRPRLEQLVADCHLGDHVKFAGSVSDDQLAKYYRCCDIFILPSRTSGRNGKWEGEGFGRVYVEAALAGKPVVGSLGGGAAEAVLDGETGILVDPTSVDAITDAMIKLLENASAATQMGLTGRRWAKENFTEDALKRSLDGLLQTCGFGGPQG